MAACAMMVKSGALDAQLGARDGAAGELARDRAELEPSGSSSKGVECTSALEARCNSNFHYLYIV